MPKSTENRFRSRRDSKPDVVLRGGVTIPTKAACKPRRPSLNSNNGRAQYPVICTNRIILIALYFRREPSSFLQRVKRSVSFPTQTRRRHRNEDQEGLLPRAGQYHDLDWPGTGS